MSNLERFIRDVPDFPKKGILFKDITPLLADPAALKETADRMAAPFVGRGVQKIVAVESRGFFFGTLLAQELGVGLVPVRKPGKLPWKCVKLDYSLEYGTASVEMHVDAIQSGEKVLIADDLLATGGTVGAACGLVRQMKGQIVGATFAIELAFLNGRAKLPGVEVHSVIRYE